LHLQEAAAEAIESEYRAKDAEREARQEKATAELVSSAWTRE
jgi:hypothetical protein